MRRDDGPSRVDRGAASGVGPSAGDDVADTGDTESPDSPLPEQFVDDDGREIGFRPCRGRRFAALVGLYDELPTTHRSRGFPPAERPALESWLAAVANDPAVVAVHRGTVVGHVVFVPGGREPAGHEMGVFVRPDYQDAGVGTALVRVGLRHARSTGVRRVHATAPESDTAVARLLSRTGFVATERSGLTVVRRREL